MAPWTVASQASLSMGFSRQEYGSGLPLPIHEAIPDPGIEPMNLASLALTRRSFTTSTTWKAPMEFWGDTNIQSYQELWVPLVSSVPSFSTLTISFAHHSYYLEGVFV